jgi:hypothetical protein
MTLQLAPWRGDNVPILGTNGKTAERAYSLSDYLSWRQDAWSFGGNLYPTGAQGVTTTQNGQTAEPVGNSFQGYVEGMLYRDGPVASVEAYRLRVFGQAPLLFQMRENGRPGDLYDDESLDLLRTPWPGGTTSDLLKRSLLYSDFGGNAYLVVLDDEVVVLRPDWVEIILEPRMVGSAQVGWRQVAISYTEGGPGSGIPVPFLRGEYAHFISDLPDPLATYRGMSWLTPIVREVQADRQASEHKVTYFENSASPNLAVSVPQQMTPDQFKEFVDAMDAAHKGPANVGKTLYTAGGADVTVIGGDMRQMDFAAVQGKGEPLALNTPIPTPTGWTTMGEVRVGDQVMGRDGRPGTVLQVGPIHEGRACYRVMLKDRTSIVADATHLWVATDRGTASRAERVYSTQEMFDILGAPYPNGVGGHRFSLPRTPVLELPDADLLIDPYVLGAWLGDGQTAGAAICGARDDLKFIACELEARGYTTTSWSTAADKVDVIGVPGGLLHALRAEGVLGNKHVPGRYLRGSAAQRLELLRGLMDTDGTVGVQGQCQFSSKLEALGRQVAELVRSLGYRASLRRKPDARSRTGEHWLVTFRVEMDRIPFLLPRKVDRCEMAGDPSTWSRSVVSIEPVASVPVRCIAVDTADHLFLAGEGLVPTHNTRIANRGGVPPTLLSFSEGMQGSSLNAGNYVSAKRNFVDTTMRDLWQNWCGSIQVLFPPPEPKHRLWYDARDIPFLHEDAKDLAEIQQTRASVIASLTREGFTPASSVDMVHNDDITVLVHTGLTSVQLTPPAEGGEPVIDGPVYSDGTPAHEEPTDAEPVEDDVSTRALAWVWDHVEEITRGYRYRHGWIPTTPLALLPAESVDDEYGREVDSVEFGDRARIVARERDVTVESDSGSDVAIHAVPSAVEARRWADAIESGQPYTRHSFASEPYEGGVAVRFGDHEVELADADARDVAQALRDMAYITEDHKSVPADESLDEVDGDETPIPDATRGWTPAQEAMHPRGREGKFRTVAERVATALAGWLRGEGDDDPLREFTNRESLRKVAQGRPGIKLRRGATIDDIKDALLADARESYRKVDKTDPDKAPIPLLTIRDEDGTRRDVLVHGTRDGKVAVTTLRTGSAGPKTATRDKRVVTVDDFDDLEAWARNRGETQLADWARRYGERHPELKSKGGVPDKPDTDADLGTPGVGPGTVADVDVNPLEDAARERQVRADKARGVAETLSELDELSSNGASARAMESRIRTRGKLNNLDPALIDDLVQAGTSGDRTRVDAAIDRIAAAHGLHRVTGPAGAVEPFDRGRHKPIGKDIPSGTQVTVVRPGYDVDLDGERVSVAKAVVQTATPGEVSADPTVQAQRRKAFRALLGQESDGFTRPGQEAVGDARRGYSTGKDPRDVAARLRQAADALEGRPILPGEAQVNVEPGQRHLDAIRDDDVKTLRRLADAIENADPAPKGAHEPLSSDPAVRQVQVENRIREAAAALKARPHTPLSNVDLRDTGAVLLSDLRAEPGLRDLPRAEVDAALKRMMVQPGVNLTPDRVVGMPDEQQSAASARIGGQDKNWLWIDDPSPRPLPGTPTPLPAVPGTPDGGEAKQALTGHVAKDVQILSGWKPGDKLIHDTKGEVTYLGPDDRDPSGTAGGGSAQWVEFADGTGGMVSADRLSGYVAAPKLPPPPRRVIPSAKGLLPDVKTGDTAVWAPRGEEPVRGKVTRTGTKIFVDWEGGRRQQLDPTDVSELTFEPSSPSPAVKKVAAGRAPKAAKAAPTTPANPLREMNTQARTQLGGALTSHERDLDRASATGWIHNKDSTVAGLTRLERDLRQWADSNADDRDEAEAFNALAERAATARRTAEALPSQSEYSHGTELDRAGHAASLARMRAAIEAAGGLVSQDEAIRAERAELKKANGIPGDAAIKRLPESQQYAARSAVWAIETAARARAAARNNALQAEVARAELANPDLSAFTRRNVEAALKRVEGPTSAGPESVIAFDRQRDVALAVWRAVSGGEPGPKRLIDRQEWADLPGDQSEEVVRVSEQVGADAAARLVAEFRSMAAPTKASPAPPTTKRAPRAAKATGASALVGSRVALKPNAGSYATSGTVRSVTGEGAEAIYEVDAVAQDGRRTTEYLSRDQFTVATTKAAKATESPADTVAKLRTATSRNDARAMLTGTRDQLKAIADSAEIAYGSKSTKAQLVDLIIQWTVGRP